MKNPKKFISLVLCVVFAASMCLTALADEVENISTTQNVVAENDAEEKTTKEVSDPEQAETPAPEQAETPAPDQAETPAPEQTETPAPVVNDGEVKVTVNGVAVVFDDVKPQIMDGRTLVPFRRVGEAMNAAVAWRAADRTVHYIRNGISVMMTIDKADMEVREYETEGKFVYTTDAVVSPIDPEQPSVIARTINDRTMVPIRAAAEALGATVGWDGATSTVIITIPEYQLKLSDKDAANLIEAWNYKPATELKTGSIEVKIAGNFEGAAPELGDGVVVTINESKQTAANGGTCVFTEVKAGTYTVTVENIPEGYAVDSAEVIQVTVEAGKPANVRIYLVKAEATSDKDAE